MKENQSSCIRKDMSHMSFVGLHNTREGIIGFADSKATLTFADGHYEEDIYRGKIRKIFKNNQFIFVTHGNNEVFSSKNRQNIEDYIEESLKPDTDYKTFFTILFDKLVIDKPEYNDGQYHFIIGSKDDNGRYFIQRLDISLNSELNMKYSEKDYDYNAYYSGEDKYVNIYNYYPKYFNLDINEYAVNIKESLTYLVNSFNVNRGYETVGLPINIEIFQ